MVDLAPDVHFAKITLCLSPTTEHQQTRVTGRITGYHLHTWKESWAVKHREVPGLF